ESLVKELEKQNIRFNNKENKDQLINLLENQLIGLLRQIKSLAKGHKKAISPEIRVLLEEYFLEGNINKSNRYIAQDMHDKLVQHVQEDEFKVEKVPKVATIQNWIGYY
ncbi:16654_t:CDS:2, partial [Gigaspora margarita]